MGDWLREITLLLYLTLLSILTHLHTHTSLTFCISSRRITATHAHSASSPKAERRLPKHTPRAQVRRRRKVGTRRPPRGQPRRLSRRICPVPHRASAVAAPGGGVAPSDRGLPGTRTAETKRRSPLSTKRADPAYLRGGVTHRSCTAHALCGRLTPAAPRAQQSSSAPSRVDPDRHTAAATRQRGLREPRAQPDAMRSPRVCAGDGAAGREPHVDSRFCATSLPASRPSSAPRQLAAKVLSLAVVAQRRSVHLRWWSEWAAAKSDGWTASATRRRGGVAGREVA